MAFQSPVVIMKYALVALSFLFLVLVNSSTAQNGKFNAFFNVYIYFFSMFDSLGDI